MPAPPSPSHPPRPAPAAENPDPILPSEDPPMPRQSIRKLRVFAFAPAGTGKTQVLKNLGSKSDAQLRRLTDPSKEMQVQTGRTTDYQPTLPTQPTGDKPL